VLKFLTSAVIVVALVEASAQGAVPTGNLVANGSAEESAGSSDGSVVPVTGWTTAGSFTVVQYGAPGFPSSRPGGGLNLFAGGHDASSGAAQTLDLGRARATIDASRVDARVSGLVLQPAGGKARIVVTLFGANGRSLGGRKIGGVDAGSLSRVSDRLPMPPGTRTMTVAMEAGAPLSGNEEALFDNVLVTLIQRRVPRPQRGKNVVMTPSRGRVVLFRRGNRKVGSQPPALPLGRPVVVPLGAMVDTSAGVAKITSAVDRFGSKTARGNFSEGVFTLSQKGADTGLSLGGTRRDLCKNPRRLVSRASTNLVVLAGASASSASPESGGGKAVWVTEDRCTATVIKRHAGQVDVLNLGSRRANLPTRRRRRRLFGHAHGHFQTTGRNSSATVRGRIVVPAG
jgi:hypothetical protein